MLYSLCERMPSIKTTQPILHLTRKTLDHYFTKIFGMKIFVAEMPTNFVDIHESFYEDQQLIVLNYLIYITAVVLLTIVVPK